MKRTATQQLCLIFALVSLISISSCNVNGFFVDAADDPVWLDPNAAAESASAGEGNVSGAPGQAVFSRVCAGCHQANGKGIAGVYPALSGSDLLQGDAEKPIKIVLNGLNGKIVRNGQEFNGLMAPWRDALSDQEIADVLNYARKQWGNSGDEIAPDKVKEVRDATAGRDKPWTESEL